MKTTSHNSGATAMPTASARTEKVFALTQPYAEHRITETDISDQALMRADQLHALTLLITGDGFPVFSGMGDRHQNDVLWLIHQLSEEVRDLIPLISRIEIPPRGAKEVAA